MSDGLVTTSDSETSPGLKAWFADRGLAGATITLHPGPQSTGASHETILFDVTHEGVTQRLVARVDPGVDGVFPAPDLSVEYRLLDALAGSDVPLPKLHAFEPDPGVLGAPFYVMERVDGVVAGDSPRTRWRDGCRRQKHKHAERRGAPDSTPWPACTSSTRKASSS